MWIAAARTAIDVGFRGGVRGVWNVGGAAIRRGRILSISDNPNAIGSGIFLRVFADPDNDLGRSGLDLLHGIDSEPQSGLPLIAKLTCQGGEPISRKRTPFLWREQGWCRFRSRLTLTRCRGAPGTVLSSMMSEKVATGRARIISDKIAGSPGQPSLGPSREREDWVLSN